ncbi:MAG: hypothetical protein ACYDCO_19760 [Armatimonadota bacterium]
METRHDLETTYQLNGEHFHAHTRIDEKVEDGQTLYQAVITDSPLHRTYGAWADSVELALDFLNLAMQAEGADEIQFQAA